MIKLLRTVNSRRWGRKKKKKLLSAFPGSSADAGSRKGSVCSQTCPLTPYICPYIVLLWPVSEPFHTHHRNYSLLVKEACLSVRLHFVCLSTPSNKLPLTLVPMSPRFCLIYCPILVGFTLPFGLTVPQQFNFLVQISSHYNEDEQSTYNLCATFPLLTYLGVWCEGTWYLIRFSTRRWKSTNLSTPTPLLPTSSAPCYNEKSMLRLT